jgi:hypothetical protein
MKAELQDAIDRANAPMAERDELADQGRFKLPADGYIR